MKKVFLGLCALLFLTLNVQSQTVDEILANYFENTGGEKKWAALKSTKIEGLVSTQGIEIQGTIYSMKPNLQRLEFDIQGKTMIQAYDGETAWMINPMMPSLEPQKMPEEAAQEFTSEQFESEFLNYKEKGHTVELIGKKEIEGAETFEVKLTKKDGTVQFHYFESENFVPIMFKRTIISGPAKGQFDETYLSDYQEVDGIMMPYFMERKMNGQSIMKITIQSITLNEDLKDDLFAFPTKKEETEGK